jgi:hypothetical protein
MRSPRAPNRWALAAWLGSLAPAVFAAVLVAANAVETFFMDDWDLVARTLVEARSGRLGIAQLLAQHNESRPFVPRLLFLAVGIASRGDTRWLLAANLALGVLVSYLLSCLIRATVTARPSHLLVLGVLANLLLFTPKQSETWLWCSYVGLEPIACIAATMVVLHSGLPSAARVAIAGVLCLAATYSYSNGLLAWVIALPVVATCAGLRWLGPWALGFVLNAAAYFWGYVRPTDLPLTLEPVRLAHYVLAFLGAPLGANRVGVATTIGALLLAVFGLVGGYGLVCVRDEGLRRRLAPWLSLGAYSVLSGIAAAIGRASLGVPHALSNRYVPFSLYLAVAVVGAIPIVWSHWREHAAPGARSLRSAGAGLALFVTGCLGLHAVSAALGVDELSREARMLRYGKTCLLFALVHLDERCLADWVYPRIPKVIETAQDLERLGYLRPALVTSPRLEDLGEPSTAPESSGEFESLSGKRARIVAQGWATSPVREGPADTVVLAERGANGYWTVIGFAPVLVPRPDVALKKGPAYRDSGWRADLLRRHFRNRSVEISAWAFDVETRSARRLAHTFTTEAAMKPRPE